MAPSPKFQIKFTASGEDWFVNEVGVFSIGVTGEKVKLAVGGFATVIVCLVVSVLLQVDVSLAISVIV